MLRDAGALPRMSIDLQFRRMCHIPGKCKHGGALCECYAYVPRVPATHLYSSASNLALTLTHTHTHTLICYLL